MKKIEFEEMVAINKALGGKYDDVVSEISSGLGFDEAPIKELITKGELVAEIIDKILTPVSSNFITDKTTEDINERGISKKQIIKHIENAAKHYNKKIIVQNIFQKKKGEEPKKLSIKHPAFIFLTTAIDQLKGNFVTYKDLCVTMIAHKDNFLDIVGDYVTELKDDNKKVWRKYYRPLEDLTLVDYADLVGKIKTEYREGYEFNQIDFKKALEKWLNDVSSSMKSIKGDEGTHSFDKAGIIYSKFSTLLNNNFNNKLDKNYAVFGDLRDILLNDFFKSCVKEQEGGKLSLGEMAGYIQKNISTCNLPVFDASYKAIDDHLYIYKQLSKINFVEDVLLAALDKTDPEFYLNDTAKGGLQEVFDNFKEKIPAAINIWKNAIVSGIKEINIDGLPNAAEILDELKNLTATYSDGPEFPANSLYELVATIHTNAGEAFAFDINNHCELTYKGIESGKLLLKKNQETIAKNWWDLLKSNVKDESANSLAISDILLPSAQRVVSCVTNNIQKGISPAKLDKQLQAWGASVKGAISQAVIGVDSKNVKISGKAFKKHLEALFASPNLPTILKRINYIIPDENILVASDDANAETIQTIWQKAISQEHLINYVTASGGQPGMLFLELYNADRIDDLKSLCDSPYLLLPSKDDIALAVYRTLKGKPATIQQEVIQLQKKVIDLSIIQDIHTLQNELQEEAVRLERAYKTFAKQAIVWMQNAENATLVYGNAYKDYSNSVDSCSKAAKKNADAWNAAIGNIALIGGVALGAWLGPVSAVTVTVGQLSATFVSASGAAAVVNVAVGTAAKQLSQILFIEAETFHKNTDTPLDFYIKMKQDFNKNVHSFGEQINLILKSLEKAINKLNSYSNTEKVEPKILDDAKIVFKSIVDELNICHEQLHGATNAFIEQTTGIVIKDSGKAQNTMESNLYRDFIKNNFEVDSSTDWNTICQAAYFLKRLRTLNVVTNSSHFKDNGTLLGLDFWPDRGWGAEMQNLIDFAAENHGNPFS